MAEVRLDCTDQRCPQPIVEVSRAMRGMKSGHRLEVRANDPAFQADLDAWIAMRGERLVSLTMEGNTTVALVEKV